MTTQDMIEDFIDAGVRAYKKHYRNKHCLQADNLDMHIETEVHGIEGVKFKYWQELAVYKMAEYIQDILPNAGVKAILNGNNSTIELEIDDEEQRKLNSKMYVFLHGENII